MALLKMALLKEGMELKDFFKQKNLQFKSYTYSKFYLSQKYSSKNKIYCRISNNKYGK